LIVTDNLGEDIAFNIGFNFAEQIKAQTQLSKSFIRLKRVHIFRKDENTFQIYDDLCTYSPWQAHYNLSNRI